MGMKVRRVTGRGEKATQDAGLGHMPGGSSPDGCSEPEAAPRCPRVSLLSSEGESW